MVLCGSNWTSHLFYVEGLLLNNKMMKRFKYILTLIILAFSLQISLPSMVQAQCPMCRMSAESNLKAGGSHGKGLNTGILMLLSLPYVMVGGIGYIWYRNRKKHNELGQEIV